MDINRFIARRENQWKRLTVLTDKADRDTAQGLTASEAEEFFALYRMASNDLNLVQTYGGGSALLDYLEMLVARALQHLAVPQRVRLFSAWWQVLRYDFPATVRKQWTALLLSVLIMGVGTVAGYAITAAHPSTALTFVPAEFFRQSPAHRVAEHIATDSSRKFHYSAEKNLFFSVYLFTHNIEVAVMTFALGLTFGLGTVVMLFFSGAMLGSLGQRYQADHVGTYFISWVGPHGVLELPAICIAATAGLMIARAMWTGGGRHGAVWASVRDQRRDLLNLLIGCAHMLVLAGVIEGGFSQITAPVLPYFLKIFFACALFCALIAYLFFMPLKKPQWDPANDE